MDNVVPFNPLDKKHLGEMVAEALLRTQVHPLGAVPDFKGAGIYAIYYAGDFPDYASLASGNRDGIFQSPIYVGKAIPAGGRRGVVIDAANSRALSGRLKEHADTVRAAADTLSIADFFCRYLVVDDIWIPLGESLLIARTRPLWNTFIDGFGNHDPGSGRYNQMRSRWDELHPGRTWALKCQDRKETVLHIRQEVREYLRHAEPTGGESRELLRPGQESSPGPTVD